MIDRSVDLISPFCNQANYEGLLDETFGIECGAMSVKRTIMYPETEETKKMENLKEVLSVKLSNEDSLFKTIRDGTLPMLGNKTKELLAALKNIQATQGEAQSIKEMSEYLQRVKKMDVAKTKGLIDSHTNLATYINRALGQIEPNQCAKLEFEIISQ